MSWFYIRGKTKQTLDMARFVGSAMLMKTGLPLLLLVFGLISASPLPAHYPGMPTMMGDLCGPLIAQRDAKFQSQRQRERRRDVERAKRLLMNRRITAMTSNATTVTGTVVAIFEETPNGRLKVLLRMANGSWPWVYLRMQDVLSMKYSRKLPT